MLAGTEIPGGGGRGVGGGGGGRGRGTIPLTYATLLPPERHCIKTGSDERQFGVPLTVRGKVTRQCPQTTTFEDKGVPKRGIEVSK